jgi:hypothetical protein
LIGLAPTGIAKIRISVLPRGAYFGDDQSWPAPDAVQG